MKGTEARIVVVVVKSVRVVVAEVAEIAAGIDLEWSCFMRAVLKICFFPEAVIALAEGKFRVKL